MSTRLHERDLLEAAGSLLRWAELARSGARMGVDERTADIQREVIALAARGLAPLARLDVLGDDAFTGAPRLLAWWCARRALRASGRRSTFAGARYALVTAPRLELPREVHEELHRETGEELDDAEAIARPSVEAIGRLLAHQRAQRARAWIAPVLEAMDRGVPAVDTGARLREAADMFEGRT